MALSFEKIVFDFNTAIEEGSATDQKGGVHKVVAHGKRHMITSCDDDESCFDANGDQLKTFPSLRLALPSMTIQKLMHCIVYNPDTMTTYDGFNFPSKALACVAELRAKGMAVAMCGNTTHPSVNGLLADLGLAYRV
jgi:hypothetical protein